MPRRRGEIPASRRGEYTEAELALAKAFACELNDNTLRSFTVERFQVASTLFEVLASPHRLYNYDAFTVQSDCGPLGYVEPVPNYVSLFAETLTPGIYTRISCELDMQVEEVPVPPTPTNIDCAHAKPLPRNTNFDPDPPTAVLDEPRVGDDQARFYQLSFAFDPDFPDATWNVQIGTNYSIEGSGGADVKLHGVGHAYEGSSFISWLNGENYGYFNEVPSGDYCVEFKVDKGVKYSIFYSSQELGP